MSKLIILYICYICVYIKNFLFLNKYNFAIKATIFQKYHFRMIYESLTETCAIVNHKHEKVKEEVYILYP